MHAFLADRRGSYAIMMGVLSVPLVLAAGFGVDVAMAHRQKAALQQAMDSAVLAGARYLPSGERAALDAADAFFAANAARFVTGGGPGATRSFEVRDGVLHGTVNYKSPTYFMQIANHDAVDLSARSAAGALGGGMELVLVLDVSGSMKGKGKIEALRSASLNLIDTLWRQCQPAQHLRRGRSVLRPRQRHRLREWLDRGMGRGGGCVRRWKGWRQGQGKREGSQRQGRQEEPGHFGGRRRLSRSAVAGKPAERCAA